MPAPRKYVWYWPFHSKSYDNDGIFLLVDGILAEDSFDWYNPQPSECVWLIPPIGWEV